MRHSGRLTGCGITAFGADASRYAENVHATMRSNITPTEIPAVYMRGGTSKGLFFHEHDLPAAREERDALLMRAMGTPDRLQIDGMGGSTSSTSKVMIIGRPDTDGVVPYWFGQVGVSEALVDWRGNCGNLTFAVAPFVVNEGVVSVDTGATLATVRLRNMNTGVRIDVDLEVAGGRASLQGEASLAGVPGTSGAITTQYLSPAGGVLGSLLPLGDPVTSLEVHGVHVDVPTVTSSIPIVGHGALASPESQPLHLPVTLVDATNPYLFVAREVIPGAMRPSAELRDDAEFLEMVETIRATAAVACGVATTVEDARREAPVTPRLVLVSEGIDDSDIHAVTVSMQQVHRGIPMTGAMCLAAARAVPGSVVADIAGPSVDGVTLIRQPLGLTRVTATVDASTQLASVGITGTARTLMRGAVNAS